MAVGLELGAKARLLPTLSTISSTVTWRRRPHGILVMVGFPFVVAVTGVLVARRSPCVCTGCVAGGAGSARGHLRRHWGRVCSHAAGSVSNAHRRSTMRRGFGVT